MKRSHGKIGATKIVDWPAPDREYLRKGKPRGVVLLAIALALYERDQKRSVRKVP